MTIKDCKEVIKLIDKNTKWFTDGYCGKYDQPMLRREEIEQLKKDIKGLITFEEEGDYD